jgi:hypothetical protein
MGGNLMMRTNETYVLNQHGDYVNSCAWGLIALTENASELKGDAHREEQLTRGCKHLDPSQEADVNRTMETLLKRAKNL